MARGGKREGAGRKSQTAGKRVPMLVRVVPELRKALEREAQSSADKSLSREIEYRLIASFKNTPDDELAAIFRLLTEAQKLIPGGEPLTKSPYRMRAFIAATLSLLTRLVPEGDVVPPPGDSAFQQDIGPDPDTCGRFIGSLVFSMARDSDNSRYSPRSPLGVLLPQAGKTLGIGKEGEKK